MFWHGGYACRLVILPRFQTGSTPAEFVETLRLNEARRRLSVPKRTLDIIAASVGFSDAQTFRRAFERRLGAKPRRHLANFNAISMVASSNGEATLLPTERVSRAQEAVAIPTED
jgi:AraC-like DNA-binding protein